MKFKFVKHPYHCYGMRTHSLVTNPLDVYSENGVIYFGFVAKSKRNPKEWVASPKSVTQNVVLKRNFKTKEEAAEYLYGMAVFGAI